MQLRSIIVGTVAIAAVTLTAVFVWPQGDQRPMQEARAMVEKAVAYLQANGPEKAFAAFDDQSNPEFHRHDIYVFVRTLDGNTIAHGAIPVMIGQTDFSTEDADGKRYNKELVELAMTAGHGWVHYRWPNPVTRRIEQKATFIQREGDYIVCAGFYEK